MNKTKNQIRSHAAGQGGFHLQGLDGLRGIAVLCVFFYHAFPNNFKGGYLGVILFFILSGYLTAIGSKRDWKNGRFSVLNYYKKRIKRIYPQLLIMVFAAAGVMAIAMPKLLDGIRGEIASILFGYNNYWQISQNASYFTRINNTSPFLHIWSLAIEMQFYLIWPLLFLLYHFIRKKWKDYSGLVILVPLLVSVLLLEILFNPAKDVTRVYYGTDTRFFSLMMGVMAGMRYRKARNRKLPVKKKRIFMTEFAVLALLSCLMLIFLDGQMAAVYRIGMIAFSFMACWLVSLLVNPWLPVGKWLDVAPLSWLGKRGYEIYLLHYPILFFIKNLGIDNVILSTILVIVLTLLVSVMVFELVHNGNTIWKSTASARRRVVYGVMMAVTVSFCAWGLYHVMTAMSAAEKHQQQLELQQELERNQRALEQAEKERLERQRQEEAIDFVTAIGDSVMLGAAPALEEAIPDCVIDAVESRQVLDGVEVVQELEQSENLGKTVVIALGTNGPFTVEQGQALLNALPSDRNVYWVTAYGMYLQWQDESNESIQELKQANPNMEIIDWAGYASSHPEWFYNDGIHLRPEAQAPYAEFIATSIGIEPYQQKEKTSEETTDETSSDGTVSDSTDGIVSDGTDGTGSESGEETAADGTEESSIE